MIHLTFVCTGNTCRSPMAEHLCRDLARSQGWDLTCDSAGLYACPGAPITPFAARAVQELTGTLPQHQARLFDPAAQPRDSLVVGLAHSHVQALRQLWPPEKVLALPQSIADPFGLDYDDYLSCARQIREGLLALGKELFL